MVIFFGISRYLIELYTDIHLKTHRKFLNYRHHRWLKAAFSDCKIALNLNHLEAILYINKTGCQWENLPRYYGPYTTVYHHFRALAECGILSKIIKRLSQWVRTKSKRAKSPTIAVIDSQSVRSALPQSQKGIDGHKRIKGIKRQIVVDSQGLPLAISTTTANVHDSKGAPEVLRILAELYPTISLVKADNGYQGSLKAIIDQPINIELRCVKSNFGTSDFVPLEGRWVVERSISWLENYRRLCRNYERFLSTALAMCQIACMTILIKRL